MNNIKFLNRFLKVAIVFLFKKKNQIFPFLFLFSIFIILIFGVIFIKNEIYFLKLKEQKIQKDIQKEQEKYEYLRTIFLNLTSYEKLIQIIDIKKFEKVDSTLYINIDRFSK